MRAWVDLATDDNVEVQAERATEQGDHSDSQLPTATAAATSSGVASVAPACLPPAFALVVVSGSISTTVSTFCAHTLSAGVDGDHPARAPSRASS